MSKITENNKIIDHLIMAWYAQILLYQEHARTLVCADKRETAL